MISSDDLATLDNFLSRTQLSIEAKYWETKGEDGVTRAFLDGVPTKLRRQEETMSEKDIQERWDKFVVSRYRDAMDSIINHGLNVDIKMRSATRSSVPFSALPFIGPRAFDAAKIEDAFMQAGAENDRLVKRKQMGYLLEDAENEKKVRDHLNSPLYKRVGQEISNLAGSIAYSVSGGSRVAREAAVNAFNATYSAAQAFMSHPKKSVSEGYNSFKEMVTTGAKKVYNNKFALMGVALGFIAAVGSTFVVMTGALAGLSLVASAAPQLALPALIAYYITAIGGELDSTNAWRIITLLFHKKDVRSYEGLSPEEIEKRIAEIDQTIADIKSYSPGPGTASILAELFELGKKGLESLAAKLKKTEPMAPVEASGLSDERMIIKDFLAAHRE